MAVDPIQPVLKSALYTDEASSFTDFNTLLRQFMAKKLRPTRTSPPILNDINELELYYDKTANRLYTKCNNVLKYVAFT